MSGGGHCSDLAGDRSLGQYWADKFAAMARDNGKMTHDLNEDRKRSPVARFGESTLILPDVLACSKTTMFVEVKHKKPTDEGKFGLENYRMVDMLAIQDVVGEQNQVLYVIHNWELRGDRNNRENRIQDWLVQKIGVLSMLVDRRKYSPTWFGGQKMDTLCVYFSKEYFAPLSALFAGSSLRPLCEDNDLRAAFRSWARPCAVCGINPGRVDGVCLDCPS